jgi:hypothetical protein
MSFLGWYVGLVVAVQDIFVPLWLLWSAQYKIFFFSPYYFKLSPSKLAGSRAGSPISQCVSLVVNPTFEKKLNDSCLCDVQNET